MLLASYMIVKIKMHRADHHFIDNQPCVLLL